MHPDAKRHQVTTALLVLAVTGPTLSAQARPAYRDPARPVEERVSDLLGRMTLEEKVAQLMSLWQQKAEITNAQGRFDPARAGRWFKLGIGRIERTSERHTARSQAEYTNAIQRWVRDSTRLGIPVLFHEESLHGLMADEATSFPQAIALASSWNPELIERVFARTALETRARGVQQVLAPVVDVALEPRWGRIEETFGEDPYLAAQMGMAAVRGLQGTAKTVPAPKVIATLKHMTGHGQPESGTNIGPASLGERTLRDQFLYPFEMAVKHAGARSVMASYNELDGIPSHVNKWMLNDILRREWGFDGVLVSDWFAIRQLIDRHHITADAGEAARRALEAGVDIELPDVDTYAALVAEVRAGRVPEARVDTAVRRLLRAKFDVGLFENPFVDVAEADRVSGAAEARPLALEAARQSIVLLQNRGNTLPLQARGLSRVAVIGPHAGEVLVGGYSAVPRHLVSIVDGLRARLGAGVTVTYAEGVRITEDSTFTKAAQPIVQAATRSGARWSADKVVAGDSAANERRIQDAVAIARGSQLAVLVLGDNEMTSREAYADNHLGDRDRLDLPGQQQKLAEAVIATGTPVVLVLINGRPMSIPGLAGRVPAILECWYLGQETGTAVAEALFGDFNPGGKLPLTVARDVGQLPVFYNSKPSARRGYVLGTTEPLYPFGFGLSYTTFAYSNLKVGPQSIAPNGRATVSIDVTNTGQRAGDEVVQLYIRDVVSQATRPVKQLRGFRRVTLRPGETRTVAFALGFDELSYHGLEMKRVVEPGRFEIMVGGNSRDVQSVSLDVVARTGSQP